jgi:hypothetical protein
MHSTKWAMRSTKRALYTLGLLVVLLSVTSARPTQANLCNPPYGSCFSYCASGSQICITTSWSYFCAILQGGCYGTGSCAVCE